MMSASIKKLKNPKRTQVVVENFVLNEIIDRAVLKELREKFGRNREVVAANLQFYIVSKQGKDIKSVGSLTLEHPTHSHFENKAVVITSDQNLILEKFLK